ncbi:uncharacterized protein MONBRDRAFT_22797 [Monosiga brevicollis MX1]|uniref:Protein kinase domain-containing protein n=1 Tax=Monosiga brevicollis TaxID=81824 RepID=A9US42_MONBE|nr:uncharacterized protein MONBRDRAFT_22797 [Monosiga brevicollis MX1]EDQ91713.1 predicted protein [Monosiga brevicollis MX1]|eukprot:XP_001742999.1 hypothetical protein [Monosiga brevicollis MX1]
MALRVGQSAATPAAPVVDGRYLLLKCLHEGSLANVHLATDVQASSAVVLKILHTSKRSYEREVAMMQTMQGAPHVVQLLDHFIDAQERPCIVMAHMEHGTLLEYIQPNAPHLLTVEHACRWGRHLVAGALQLALRNLVHGDIKPENCLINARGELILHDLGCAVGVGYKHGGQPAGTRAYLAPEVLLGQPSSSAQDAWAVGLVLFAILFADLPWERAMPSDPNYRLYLQSNSLPDPHQRLHLLTPAFRTWLHRLLDPDPRRRASLAEMHAFLQAHPAWFVNQIASPPSSLGSTTESSSASARASPSPAVSPAPPRGSPSHHGVTTQQRPYDQVQQQEPYQHQHPNARPGSSDARQLSYQHMFSPARSSTPPTPTTPRSPTTPETPSTRSDGQGSIQGPMDYRVVLGTCP